MDPISVEIRENREIATGIFRLRLLPSTPLEEVRPGSFFMVGLGEGNDPLLRRPLGHMGVVRTEEGAHLHEFLYEVRGRGTKMLSQLRPSAVISIIGPLGNGWKLEAIPGRVILAAGGMGVVPLYSALKTLSVKPDGPELKFLFGARTGSGLVMSDEIGRMCPDAGVCTEDGCKGVHGLVTDLLGEALSEGAKDTAVLACGPRPMLRAIAKMTADFGVPCQVSLEARMGCGMGACLTCSIKGADGANVRVCREGPVFDAKDIDWEDLDACP